MTGLKLQSEVMVDKVMAIPRNQDHGVRRGAWRGPS